jgi:class 3 adenylate cyclase/tetratricopeptide (TPR) repeat protein
MPWCVNPRIDPPSLPLFAPRRESRLPWTFYACAMVRKTVTVVFADLVGSTALGERTDPEVLQGLMQRFHAQLRGILERHGGTVEKFIGDAAMAVFGVPQAHEDDALRAVRAATEIRERVAGLGMEVRIGVNTGEVVTGEGETLVAGDAVNVAARLEQAAQRGEVLIGETTERLVRAAVSAEPVEPLPLRGKAQPVAAFRLLEVAADIPAFARPIAARFVGREDELHALEAALSAAVEQRQPHIATIVGPPGIGKSRLARELIGRSQARVLVGRCLSYGEGITYWPLQEIVQQIGNVSSVVDDELVVRRIDAAVVGGDATADEIALAFRRLFEALAQERPLIVVLDDIHWAEPTLLDLIDYLSAFAADASLLLLCSARPDLFEHRPQWTAPKPNAALLTLEPLAAEQTKTLVDELGDLPEETKLRIVEAAEGNPLFVEQLVAYQAESGDGVVEIPPTIQALLAARIDRLEPAERAVIERASIEGRFFHRGSVQALLPEEERAAVGSYLLTLVRKDFVRPDRSQFSDDDGFRFGHILICDAAYDSIAKRLRAELHEQFAAWLEERLGDDATEEILGYHLEQAYRYRAELGFDDEHARGLALRAGRLLGEAGERANARLDIAAASSLLGRATELLPADDAELPALLTLYGTSVFDAGNVPRAQDALMRARDAALAAGQRGVALRARMNELVCVLVSARDPVMDQALAEAQAAIQELEELSDTRGLLAAWRLVAWCANMAGKSGLRTEASLKRFKLAKGAGVRREAADAARTLVFSLAAGNVEVKEAIRQAEETLADFPEEPECELALLYALAGRHEDAAEAMARGRRAQLELGHRLQYAADSMDVAEVAMLAGHPERAEQDLREGAAFLEAAGERGWLSTVAEVLAEVLYQLGRYDEAEEWSRRSEEASPPDDVVSHARWRAVRAKVLARRGDAKDADRLSAESVEWAFRSDMPKARGDCLFDRGEVLRLLGRSDEAHAALKEALAVYERKGITPAIERTTQAIAHLNNPHFAVQPHVTGSRSPEV